MKGAILAMSIILLLYALATFVTADAQSVQVTRDAQLRDSRSLNTGVQPYQPDLSSLGDRNSSTVVESPAMVNCEPAEEMFLAVEVMQQELIEIRDELDKLRFSHVYLQGENAILRDLLELQERK